MRIIKSPQALHSAVITLKKQNKRVGFVPTMGALHEGHASLIRRSRRENDITVISIFVNPMQFGPKEDFAAYPRPEKNDILLAKKELVDIIFYPSEKIMYPTGFLTSVEVGRIGGTLCGKSRPGHFRGVATVVNKLLNIVAPDTLYLGQKDAQQAAIIKQMARDLNIPVAIRVCPTVREKSGLALSSRNSYLSRSQRAEASVLCRALLEAKQRVRNGERSPLKITRLIQTGILKKTSGSIDYIDCVGADDLRPMKHLSGKILIALAVRFGKTRLIDNVVISIPNGKGKKG